MPVSRQTMQHLGAAIEFMCNEGEAERHGFALLVFPVDGDPGKGARCLSNVDLEFAVAALRSCADELERRGSTLQ